MMDTVFRQWVRVTAASLLACGGCGRAVAPEVAASNGPNSVAQLSRSRTMPQARARPGDVRQDMFGAPAIVPRQPAARRAAVPPTVDARTAPADPLAGWTLTGIAAIGVNPWVSLENKETGEKLLLDPGARLGDFRVAGVSPSSVELRHGRAVRRIVMNQDFDVTPLDRDAAFLGGRETPHRPRSSPTTDAAIAEYAMLRVTSALDAVGSKALEELTNDVFDGRITQDEFDRRVGNANSVKAELELQTADLEGSIAKQQETDALVRAGAVSAAQAQEAAAATAQAKANVAAAQAALDAARSRTQRLQRRLEAPRPPRTMLCGSPENVPTVA